MVLQSYEACATRQVAESKVKEGKKIWWKENKRQENDRRDNFFSTL
jgi:hypothetical protein